MPVLACPRDHDDFRPKREHGIDLDVCPTCGGAWYDFAELKRLEETVTRDEGGLAGTRDYAKHESQLKCPVCAKGMISFNYRGNPLELDVCPDEHGFWLDAGEAERVREFMRERLQGIQRSGSAQAAWARAKGRRGGGIIDQIRTFFTGHR